MNTNATLCLLGVMGALLLPVSTAAECSREIVPPSPVISIQSPDPRQLLKKIVDLAEQKGFKPEGGINWDEGWFRSKFTESPTDNYQVAIWLQWNLRRPGEEITVFLDYGKYHKYTGARDWKLACKNPNLDTPINELTREILRLAGLP
jgi:hypothetical protein